MMGTWFCSLLWKSILWDAHILYPKAILNIFFEKVGKFLCRLGYLPIFVSIRFLPQKIEKKLIKFK